MSLISSTWTSAAVVRKWAALILGSVVLGALLAACGGHAKSNATTEPSEPIEECDSFVAAYGRCLGNLGPERIANARADQTRAALAIQISQAHGEPARAALRQKCVDNLSRLTATCH